MIDRTKEFRLRPKNWRIEAVIHDGSWYDIKKWARVAKVSKTELIQWLEENEKKFRIIRSEVGESFRVDTKEVLRWYSTQTDISIEDKIIPKNYPPRIWDGKTEVEAFLSVPRRTTATLTFVVHDSDLLKKITLALQGVARVRYTSENKYKAYGLSDTYIQKILQTSLTPKEYASLEVKKRKGMLHRELTDFSQEFIEKALTFYLPFSQNAVKNYMSTLRIYLPEQGDIDSQLISWVVSAMRKFDETKPVPFSGYLSNVLRFWPYDLPDQFLGKKLSSFQRKRKKAMDRLTKVKGHVTFTSKEIADEMGMDMKTYVELESEHNTWTRERTATTLNWEDSANEKQGTIVGVTDSPSQDLTLSSKISISAINATLSTGDFESGLAIIESLDGNLSKELMKKLHGLPPEFKMAFGKELVKEGVRI